MIKNLSDFDVLCEQANRYFTDNEMENALDCYRKALDLVEGQEELNQEKFRILNNIGIAHVRLKQFEMAVTAFGRARDISAAIGDRHNAARQMGNIGSAYRDMEEHDSALQHYHDSLAAFEDMGDIFGIASQCSNVAYIHAMKGENEVALEWFDKAKKNFEAAENRELADLTLQNINTLKSMISSGD